MKKIKRDTDQLMRLWKKICRTLRECGDKEKQDALVERFKDLAFSCVMMYSQEQLAEYGWVPSGINSLERAGRNKR